MKVYRGIGPEEGTIVTEEEAAMMLNALKQKYGDE